MNITPIQNVGSYKQGTLVNLSAQRISEKLGFNPNVDDDPYKVENSWGFEADGVKCAIWDWKGSQNFGRFSFFGPSEVFETLFPGHVE